MALATRNLYLVLKARDEASRVIRGFGRELQQAGRLAQAEQLRNRAGIAAERAAYMASIGASQHDIDQQNLLARSLRRQASELERAHAAAVRFSAAMQQVSATLITIGSGIAIGGGAILAFLYSAIKVTTEYARQVAMTATQVTGFKASLEDISQIGLRVAKNIAVPFEQIQPALYDIFSSVDVNMKQAELLLTSFAKTAVAGQVSLQDAARGTIPILNAFNLPMEDVNRILDIQFQLVRKGVGTYGEFSKVFGRVVPSATRAGQTFETVAAMLTYMTRNGLSTAMAAASAGRALDAMSNPKAVAAMEALGIKVRDVNGNFLPLEQTLMTLRDHLMKMPPADRVKELVAIFKGAGGTIQARRFLDQILLKPGELEQYIGFLGDMKHADGAFQDAYVLMSNTVAAQTELLKNKWKVLQEALGKAVTPAFVGLLKILNKVLDWFNGLSPAATKAIGIFLFVAGVFGIIAGAVVIVLGVLAGVFAAIVSAGAGFFYLLGAVLGVVAVLGLLTAAFVLAWTKSQGFRDIIGNAKDTLIAFWKEAVVPTALAIKKAWDEHMGPALNKLHDVIETKILPSVISMHKKFKDEFLPAAKEVGNWIKDVLTKAFEAIGWVITTVVIPALTKVAKFYKDHETTIKQVVGVLMWLAKWGIKIGVIFGAIIAVIFAGPVVAAVAAVIAVFLAIVAVIILIIEAAKWIVHWFGTAIPAAWNWLVDVAKKTWKAISDFFVGIWNGIVDFFKATWNGIVNTAKSVWKRISDFFVGIWEGIVSFFAGVWKRIVNVFNSVMDTVKSAWNTFWNSSIGGLLKAIWGLIVAIVSLGIAAIMFVILWGLKFITDIWNWAWNGLKNGAIAIWNFIFPYLKGAWEGIVAVATTIWNGLVNFFVGIWNWIKNTAVAFWGWLSPYLIGTWNWIVATATGIWNALVNFFVGVWNWIKNTAISVWNAIRGFLSGVWNGIISTGKSAWNGFVNFFSGIWNTIKGHVNTVWKEITGFFSNTGTWLLNAGKNLIGGLIDGITSRVKEVTNIINGLAKTIRDFWPHSPAKKGPLSGRGGMFYAGQNMMKQLQDGILSQQVMLGITTSLAAGTVGSSLTAPGAGSGRGSVNQTFNITTQEINPRKHAAELGFLLGGR